MLLIIYKDDSFSRKGAKSLSRKESDNKLCTSQAECEE